MLSFTTFYHVQDESALPITCGNQAPGATLLMVGDIYIFARRDQLQRIYEVVGEYLSLCPKEDVPVETKPPVFEVAEDSMTDDVAF